MNAVEIEQAISELAEANFDATEFPYQFLVAFGNKDTTIKRLRSGNNNKSDIDNGVLQRNNIHLATCAFFISGVLDALKGRDNISSELVDNANALIGTRHYLTMMFFIDKAFINKA